MKIWGKNNKDWSILVQRNKTKYNFYEVWHCNKAPLCLRKVDFFI